MKLAASLSLLLTILLLLAATVTVLPTSVSAQGYQEYNILISEWGPSTAVRDQTTTLQVRVLMEGLPSGTAPAKAQVTWLIDGGTIATTATNDAGWAQTSWRFLSSGTHTITARATATFVVASAVKEWSINVSSPATPTPQPQQPTATQEPRATVVKSTPTPTAQQPIGTIYVPPPTVINQVIPGTITQGTGPWGTPRVTVKNPGPDKLRTTLIDFASNPEDNTAHYNEQVGFANADGWKLTARGEKTYGDPSKDYRYSRFVKGTSTLLLAAQGNNSTEKQYDIPGDVLITEQDETFSDTAGFSLFGLEGLAAYAVVAVIGIAILALIVVAVVYYRRQDRD